MGHITAKSYKNLQKRLDKSPQGAPESETLFKILEHLFTKKEAEIVTLLPMNFFTVEEAAKRLKKPYQETKQILDNLADKAILLDTKKGNTKAYIMAATMAGFFEYSLMRTDGKFDPKLLSELYHQYINEEKDFVAQIFALDPSMDRVFVHEDKVENPSEILDYERATKVIDNAHSISLGRCYCRHKMEHLSKACDAPQNVCLTFNNPARSLIDHGISKEISKEEAHKILKDCIDRGLVQIGDNVQDSINWICNCCGCCCEALLAYKRLGIKCKIKSNYFAKDKGNCIGCSICEKKCPVDAIKIVDKKVKIDKKICIGCGVCTRFCPTKTLTMARRKEIQFVPKDVFERYVLAAINEGKLQNFIFDNQTLWTHRVMRKFLGFFLKLTPTKRLLVQKQMQSRYLQVLIKAYYKLNKKDYGKIPDYSHPEMKK